MSNAAKISRRDFLKNSTTVGSGLVIGFYLPGASKTPFAGPSSDAAAALSPLAQADDTFAPNAWVQIEPDNTITIWVSKSEMGQGVSTALPMIVAEELEADWSAIRIEQAPADEEKYGNQTTWGSTSVSGSFNSLRQAGATARTLLVAAAAQTWGVDPATCQAENGVVSHPASGRELSYGELATTAAALDSGALAEEVRLKDPEDFRLIGTRALRKDSPEVVTGRAIFGLDVRRPGMLYAVLARCPFFEGSLVSFDATEAEQVAGVRHVIQVGEAIAVVADNTWAAWQGQDALQITWDEGPSAQLSSAEISQTFAAQVEELMSNDTVEPPAAAAQTLEAIYELPFLAHASMEPMNCTADIRADAGEVWAPTQIPQRAKQAAAEASGLPLEAITLHVIRMGGAFGRRAVSDFVTEAVQISQAVKAPVQVVWSREDDIQHDFYRPATYHRLRAELDDDGQLLQWRHYFALTGWGSTAGAELPYTLADQQVDSVSAPFPVPTGIWRSVEFSYNTFVVESFFDEVAAAGDADPYELRYQMADSERLKAVLELAADRGDWGTPLPAGQGRGIAACIYGHGPGKTYVAQVAEVSVADDGEVQVQRVVCAFDCGMIVNPDIVEAQIEGSIVYGLTAALKGEITVADGQIQQSNFHDYTLLRMDEMPAIEIYLVPSTEPPNGAGEPAVPTVAPAVTNAIFAATGKRIRRLPIRPEDLQSG